MHGIFQETAQLHDDAANRPLTPYERRKLRVLEAAEQECYLDWLARGSREPIVEFADRWKQREHPISPQDIAVFQRLRFLRALGSVMREFPGQQPIGCHLVSLWRGYGQKVAGVRL